jgi:hypothetical protein
MAKQKLPLKLNSFRDSQLFLRLNHDATLTKMVETVASDTKPLLADIARHMPLFTLHDERHILNVIAWMEFLLEPVISEIGPDEAALLLMAAYVHDLGMSLSTEDHEKLRTPGTTDFHEFQSFLDGFPEDRKQIQTLPRVEANLIEARLLTEFLRRTHAGASENRRRRMRTQLSRILGNKTLATNDGIDLREYLEPLAASHNESASWLRGQAIAAPVNLPFLGLVLRLADILDFDSSRTPRILFSHYGFEGGLSSWVAALDPAKISEHEWRKHLAVQSVEFDNDNPQNEKLTYQAFQCPSPAVEHSIRHFIGIINSELSSVRDELTRIELPLNGTRRNLRLPAVTCTVTPKSGAYVYKDWQFHTNHEEIINLLMGESLYGEPGLAIRELLQNSLDALELRDLRLRYRRATGGMNSTANHHTDGVCAGKDGWFIDTATGQETEFRVHMTWGHDDARNRDWLEIDDNGVGMSRATIEKYFTQLGKSFYRSEDFQREAEILRKDAGLICTPISQFGIGVLSAFMLADRIDIRTHCGGTGPEVATDFHVSGPGTLFWIQQGSRIAQGTSVRLWLRQNFPVRHNWRGCLSRLRENQRIGAKEPYLDPVFEAANYVVWPQFPITWPGSGVHRLDAEFHTHTLFPIDRARFLAKAAEWEIELPERIRIRWASLDWVDNDRQEGTGSRIRLWFPELKPEASPVPFWLLCALVESQLEWGERHTRTLVRSMNVEGDTECKRQLAWAAGAGVGLWLDLRGPATPRLTADRKTALVPSRQWDKQIAAIFRRWEQHIAGQRPSPEWFLQWGMRPESRLRLAAAKRTSQGIRMPQILNFRVGTMASARKFWTLETLAWWQSAALDQARASTLNLAFALARGSAIGRDLESVRALDRDRDLVLDLGSAPDRYLDRALDHALNRALAVDRARARARARALDVDLDVDLARALDLAKQWWIVVLPEAAYSHLFQEAYFPDLQQSWPPLAAYSSCKGLIGDAQLVGPGQFLLQPDSTGALIPANDHPGNEKLRTHGFDLCLPMTTIPLGSSQMRAQWKSNRRARLLCMLPFLFPAHRGTWRTYDSFPKLSGTEELYLLVPPYELWYKPFAEWAPEDWSDPAHLCLLYDNRTGETLISHGDGVVSREQTKKSGKPYREYAEHYIKMDEPKQRTRTKANRT